MQHMHGGGYWARQQRQCASVHVGSTVAVQAQSSRKQGQKTHACQTGQSKTPVLHQHKAHAHCSGKATSKSGAAMQTGRISTKQEGKELACAHVHGSYHNSRKRHNTTKQTRTLAHKGERPSRHALLGSLMWQPARAERDRAHNITS